jgi:c-di-AMP phosphodiesterase-like protein
MKNKNTSVNISKDIIWPVLAGLLFLIADILVFSIDVKSGVILACFVFVFLLFSLFYYPYHKKKMMQETMDFMFEQSRVQNHLIKELPLPYVLIGGDGDIMWYNQAFEKILDGKSISKLQQMFPELDKNLLPSEMNHSVSHVKKETLEKDQERTCFYKIEFVRIQMDSLIDEETESKSKQWLRDQSMVAAYFFDQTMLKMYMEQNENQRMVVGLIYIDNYEELLDNVDEVKQSMLLALADQKINKFIQNISGIVKKTEKDKYLEKVKKEKFHILEEVKSINLGSSGNMTLSISLGINGQSYQENYEAACTAMDLALGRGGDQAVIKDGEDISYFGENAAVVEKNTRVKARVKAHALRELLESKDNVVIMSHKIPDPDAMGAAVGLYRLGLSLGRKAHIVMNEATISVRPIVEELLACEEYDEDMFITSDTAKEITDDNTLLIVVDVNHASYTECEELLDQTNTIVILDHHRKGKETIKYPVLSYIEPYASSTCELVAEVLQYIATKPKLLPVEANAMYFGMLIDTDNFVNKTGVRTFEAAAFLKRSGADLNKVRKMSRTSLDTYKIRAKAVSDAEIMYGSFAIATLVGIGIDSPTVVGAQVANELLDIDGIKASFVLTGVEERVYVSARSIDEVNVQKIMEQFGGGGHLTVAGAQMVDVSLYDAKQIIKGTLQFMKEEGDI